jgi:hypothetical protein
MGSKEFWLRLNPAVPRHWLFAIAATIWSAVGLLLCSRAIVWLSPLSISTGLLMELTGIAVAAIGYLYLFFRAVQHNIKRIHALPTRACVFAFTAWRGYVMIALMVTLGLTLRSSSIPKYYLSMPYTAMGVMLLIGGAGLFRQFFYSTRKSGSVSR